MTLVDKAITDTGLNEKPKVFLSDEVQGDVRAQLETTALTVRCPVVRTEAEATHVVVGPAAIDRTSQPLCKVSAFGDHTEVHSPGSPDSHNRLLPTSSLPASAVERADARDKWVVCAQWLADSGVHNELMNPADYVSEGALPRMSDEEFLGKLASKAGQQGKRKREEEGTESLAKRRGSEALRKLPDPEAQPKVTQVEDTHPEATRERPPELKPPRNPEMQKIPSAGRIYLCFSCYPFTHCV